MSLLINMIPSTNQAMNNIDEQIKHHVSVALMEQFHDTSQQGN